MFSPALSQITSIAKPLNISWSREIFFTSLFSLFLITSLFRASFSISSNPFQKQTYCFLFTMFLCKGEPKLLYMPSKYIGWSFFFPIQQFSTSCYKFIVGGTYVSLKLIIVNFCLNSFSFFIT